VAWHSVAMHYVAAPGNDIPGFAIIGAIMGIAFVWVAIRFMFGRKK
jgi:flagellar motor component MotA